MKTKQADTSRERSKRFASVGPGETPAAVGVNNKVLPPFSASELQQIDSEITAQWFQPVATQHLTLMEIDPWNLYACWHISAADLAIARARMAGLERGSALMLRFFDISASQHGALHQAHFDVEVHESSTNWYVNLWRDARHYSAELGLRAADGTFVALVRSNEVVTPRAGPSPELDFREMQVCVPPPLPALPLVEGTRASDILLRDLFPRWHEPVEGCPPTDNSAAIAASLLPTAAVLLQSPEIPEADGSFDATSSQCGTGMAAFEPSGDFPYIAAAEIASWHDHALNTRSQVLAKLSSPMPSLPQVSPAAIAPPHVKLFPQPLPIRAEAALEPATAGRPVRESFSDIGETGGVPNGASAVAPDAGKTPTAHDAEALSAKPPPSAGLPVSGSATVALEAMLANAISSPGSADSPHVAPAHLRIEGQVAPDTRLTLFGHPVPVQESGRFFLQLPLSRGPELAALLHHLRGQHSDWRES